MKFLISRRPSDPHEILVNGDESDFPGLEDMEACKDLEEIRLFLVDKIHASICVEEETLTMIGDAMEKGEFRPFLWLT